LSKNLILLVEDNPDDEMLTMDALANNGFQAEVAVVRDGAEALDYLFATGEHAAREGEPAPKLVLLDLKLPKVDGLEVLRRIRAAESTKRIPVVILTSSTEDSDLQRGYDYGANSYIQKQVEFDRFVDVVKTLGLYWLVVNRVPRK
jgi:two-component system response regulator